MPSLYFHIPFCETKCVYCDFYSLETLSPLDEFLKALTIEIEIRSQFTTEQFETIFFGGGTPSLLSPKQMGHIFNLIHKHFTIAPDAEITVECNPGTITVDKLRAYRALGVNRLSFGVQSFFEDDLKFLSRIHNVEEAKDAIGIARSAGFENVNLDLIFALPEQTLERWQANLQQAVALEPTHISAYSLIVEQNTPLYRMVNSGQVATIPTERDALMFELTMEYLTANGYEQYEVSNYGKKGLHCRHNKNYWNHTNYLSFGPSAHSYWNDGEAKRWWNIANLSTYCKKLLEATLPIAGEETLTQEQLFEEMIMLGLRSEGIDIVKLNTTFATDFIATHQSLITELLADGYIHHTPQTLRLTRKGYVVCEEIIGRVLEDSFGR